MYKRINVITVHNLDQMIVIKSRFSKNKTNFLIIQT